MDAEPWIAPKIPGRPVTHRGEPQVSGKRTDFSLFRERLGEACRARNMTQGKLCLSIGIGGRSAIKFDVLGVRALDLCLVCQIADRLDVSLDWLLGRSDVMDLPALPEE